MSRVVSSLQNDSIKDLNDVDNDWLQQVYSKIYGTYSIGSFSSKPFSHKQLCNYTVLFSEGSCLR